MAAVDDIINLSLDFDQIKNDLVVGSLECSARGLVQCSKWLSELSFSVDQVSSKKILSSIPPSLASGDLLDYDRYTMSKNYFDLQEYDRAAYFLTNCESPRAYFLCKYAKYLAGEKKILDNATDSIGPQDNIDNSYLKQLRSELQKKVKLKPIDGYLYYLYGIVLKKLDLKNEAIDAFIEAINSKPIIWGAWQELSLLISDKEMLSVLNLPDHWIKDFFLALTNLELHLNEEALKIYQALFNSGFSKSTYVTAQIALSYHNCREVDTSMELFTELQNADPYRLENMDTYSNILFVKEMRAELAHLAYRCCEIDKYHVETCCVIGNFYSLRSQHDKAILYFLRALKLNPDYLSAWTLMGHEYMELKNSPAAIQAYRQAIEVNSKDYRAWYGLGQTYEILKMPFYSLYYYRKAQTLKPNDSRMVVALGESYERLDRLQEAKKCYWKAHSMGDLEGIAVIKLAKLYERLGEDEQSAAAYTEYINENEQQNLESADRCHAYRFLANYYLKTNRYEEAYAIAMKCTEFNEIKEEGKAILRQISMLRAKGLGDGDIAPATILDSHSVNMSNDRPRSALNSSNGEAHTHTPFGRLPPMNLTFMGTP